MSMYDDVADCAAAYVAARDALDDDAVSAADAVLRTRVELAECLIAAGWTPSQEVAESLDADRTLLLEPAGSVERLAEKGTESRSA